MGYSDYVNPLMGSKSSPEFSNGNTYPAVSAPAGLTAWTPMTALDMRNGWIYQFDKEHFTGIKVTHLPSPWINDYGDFAIMPVLDTENFSIDIRGTLFSHENEIALPYYYKILLSNGISIELVPTERAANVRIQYPELENRSMFLVIDTVEYGDIEQISGTSISGIARDNHGGVSSDFGLRFVIKSSRNFKLEHKTDSIAVLKFGKTEANLLELKIGTSFISHRQAMANLKREIGDRTFDAVKADTKKLWDKKLSCFQVEGADDEQLKTFYTCLYRNLLFPRVLHEFDECGRMIHYSPYNGSIERGIMYADHGFWDTYRTVYPLYSLCFQNELISIIRGWLNACREGGRLPKWPSPGYRDCMIGTSIVNVIVDALYKGILKDFSDDDIICLYEACRKDGVDILGGNSFGRKYLDLYMKHGFIPIGENRIETTSRTQEYAYNDYCLAMFAKYLGRADDYSSFIGRAVYYKNVFDESDGFFKGRLSDGSFDSEFSEFDWGGPFNGGGPFTEGCAWQHLFYVPHDIAGLIELFGGLEPFEKKLNRLFEKDNIKYNAKYYSKEIHEIKEMIACGMGQYSHNNQPVHNYIYLYNYIGKPWKTQKLVRYVVDNLYGSGADGFCGDEDNGELGAWYVLSSIGIYPVCPGASEPYYVIGSPRFRKVILNVGSGKTFIINTVNNSNTNIYIQSVKLNSVSYYDNWISHSSVIEGGILDIVMGDKPNRSWGSKAVNCPLSKSSLEKL